MTQPPPTDELTVTLRIDKQPGHKRFQGVWLEFPDGTRWVVDYRAADLWKPFEDQQVHVSGERYTPDPNAQSISKQHFAIRRIRLAGKPTRPVPYIELGPRESLTGEFVTYQAPPGSKLAGSSIQVFRDATGDELWIAGAAHKLPPNGPATIMARRAVPDRSYAAMPGNDQIYVLSVSVPGDRP